MPTPQALAAALAETAPAVMDVLRDGARAAKKSDLTLPQLRCVGFVDRHEGASLSDVAAHVGVSLAAASQLVDALVERKLVRRDTATDDRRRIRLALTAAGRAQLRDARAGATAALARVLERLSARELAALGGALVSLQRALQDEVVA